MDQKENPDSMKLNMEMDEVYGSPYMTHNSRSSV